jgi:hypothetical protein
MDACEARDAMHRVKPTNEFANIKKKKCENHETRCTWTEKRARTTIVRSSRRKTVKNVLHGQRILCVPNRNVLAVIEYGSRGTLFSPGNEHLPPVRTFNKRVDIRGVAEHLNVSHGRIFV